MNAASVLVVYVFLPWIGLALFLYGMALYVLPSRPAEIAAFLARSMGYILGLLICATYGSIASLFLKIFGKGGLGQWTTAKSFKWIMYPLSGVWFNIEGDGARRLAEVRPAVFVANHQSELDILFIAHVWPKYTSVTAKSDLKYYPFLGWFMYLSNTVFINRKHRSSALAAFDAAAKYMQTDKQSVFIFPEGTRSYYTEPDLLPFKKGAFHLAIQAQVPIVPIVCANYSSILSFKKIYFHSGRIPVRVLKPIDTRGLTSGDVEDLMKFVREDMLKALKEMHSRPTDGVAVEDEIRPVRSNGHAVAMKS